MHEQATGLFYDRQFEDAERLFQKVQEMLPGDRSSSMFAERCRSNLANPPGPEWTGAMAMTVK